MAEKNVKISRKNVKRDRQNVKNGRKKSCTKKKLLENEHRHPSHFGGTVLEIQNSDQSINWLGTGHSSFNHP